MPAKSITIAGIYFPTKTSLIHHLRALLGAGGPDDQITDPGDAAILSELFHARQSKSDELSGRKITGWGRLLNPANQCFAAICDDRENLHFSYPKSLDALYAAQDDDED